MAIVQKIQPGAQKVETRGTATAKPTLGAIPPDKIAARAYEIWVAKGRPDGHDQEHWFQAERELRSPQASRGTQH
jgi:Protein of unknown function (DUF2934)